MAHFPRSLWLAAVSASLAAAFTACLPNPTEWDDARIEPFAALTFSCPNLEGTYALKGGGVPMSQTAFGRLATSDGHRFPWETMTIQGDADDSLVLTLARGDEQRARYRDYVFARGAYYERQYKEMHTPEVRWRSGFATMTDEQYARNIEELYLKPVESHALRRGRDYTCGGGWLRVDRLVHDPGPDRNNPRPDTVIGEVHVRKGWKGELVARSEFDEDLEFSVWCGDGCQGVPIGNWTMHAWGRWQEASPASDGTLPRPWAEPFAPPPAQPPRGSAVTSPDVIARELRPMIPAAAQLQSVRHDQDGYRVVVTSDSTAPFTELVASLRRSYRFRSQRVLGLTRGAQGEWAIALGIGDVWHDSPATPHDATRAAWESLPPAVKLVGSGPAPRRGLELTLVSTDQSAIDRAAQAIASRPEYDSVAVMSNFRAEHGEIVTRVYIRERPRR